MDQCANGSIQSQIANRKSKNARKAFTIVELLMVMGIISVLITITTSVVTGSLQSARKQKAAAICTIVEQGIATYYAQKDEWPITGLEDKTPNADKDYQTNTRYAKVVYLLDDGKAQDGGEVQKMVMNVITEMQQNKSRMMDVSGLFVAKKGSKYGMDFFNAVRGTKDNKDGIRLSEMVFGYPDEKTGKFCHFRMAYVPETDSVKVFR